MRPEPGGSDRSTLSSVTNALLLLGYFEKHDSISVSEAARLLNVAPSSAHRALTTLKDMGFVRQQESGRRYEAGHRLLDIALGALSQINLREIARPYLEELSNNIPAQIWLIKLDSTRAYSFDMHMAKGISLAKPDVISSSPAHTLAAGKLLLSRLSDAQIDKLYPSEELEVSTDRSIRRKTELLHELELIRRYDYAVQIRENIPESGAVAVPLYGAHDELLGALSVSGPAEDYDPDSRRERILLARQTAAAIAQDIRDRLRYRPGG
ncbi:IclR family transcriptional regulator [Rhodococcus sp. WS4]|nr:IclR family transcriptional regulator [Rhodococcus sp. WS4]